MTKILSLLLLFLGFSSLSQKPPVNVYYESTETGAIVYADNDGFCPYTLELEMDLNNNPVCNEKADPRTEKRDTRVSNVGKRLRKLYLDELPQFINVLKGQMSIIGPRPEQAKLTQIYEQDFYCYRFRHFVKPGITGWAQGPM